MATVINGVKYYSIPECSKMLGIKVVKLEMIIKEEKLSILSIKNGHRKISAIEIGKIIDKFEN